MIVDRYDLINLFEMIPKLNLELEPEIPKPCEQLSNLCDVFVGNHNPSVRTASLSTPLTLLVFEGFETRA